MGFQTGLSGLNASSRNLDVIGHNIANVNTVGMKVSRTEFSDVVSSSLGVGGGNNTGIGVNVDTVSQQFSQGTISISGNDLDVAISGGGFFQLQMADGTISYTRNGQFKLDPSGNIVTNAGAKVMGYPTDSTGKPTSTSPQALQLPTGAPLPASATTKVTAEFNLDARAAVYNAGLNIPPYTTYGTAITVYDSQGVAQSFGVTFTRAAAGPLPPAVAPNYDIWDVRNSSGTALVDATTGNPIKLYFDATGKLVSPVPGGTMPKVTITPAAPSIVPAYQVTLDVGKATQYGTPFAISDLTQDGYPPGSLVGVKIGEDGVITGRYSNGKSQAAGMLALANFRNMQGLAPVGNNNWVETASSGPPVPGRPGVGNFGTTRSGALEDSNIDLTAELVNMMTAQRAYQANAQTIKTQDQVMQTLVNLR